MNGQKVIDNMFLYPKLASLLVFFALTVIYCAFLAIYRLYLSPIAKIPGPKLAALTFWYQFYHDVTRDGQYIFEIEKMHQKYGM